MKKYVDYLVVVINKLTGQEVPYVMDGNEIKITSTDPKNTDETCIVQTIQVDRRGKLQQI